MPFSSFQQPSGPWPQFRRLLSSGWARAVMMVLTGLCMISIPLMSLSSRTTLSQGQLAARDLPIALQRLERTIGYAGFIHNFKNGVLRPAEPVYFDRAAADHRIALAAMTEIEELTGTLGQPADIAPLRDTLGAYRAMIDRARTAQAQGASIAEVDALVRLSDDEAALALAALNRQVHTTLAAWLDREQRHVRLTQAGLSALFFLLSLILLTLLVLSYGAERDRRRQSAELQSRLDALGQLTAGIAHDVNNLLATILYAVDLTLGDKIPDSSAKFLHSARRAVERGQELTGRLLSFARPQPGHPETLMVGEIFLALRELSLPHFDGRIALDFHETVPGLSVRCDRSQIENAVLNLILNARDAIALSGHGSRILVTAAPLDQPGFGRVPHLRHVVHPQHTERAPAVCPGADPDLGPRRRAGDVARGAPEGVATLLHHQGRA